MDLQTPFGGGCRLQSLLRKKSGLSRLPRGAMEDEPLPKTRTAFVLSVGSESICCMTSTQGKP